MAQVGHADALRAAVIALHESGSATVVLSAAIRSVHWRPAVVDRVRALLPSFAGELASLGFDVAQLIEPTPDLREMQRARPRGGFGCGPSMPPLDPVLRAPPVRPAQPAGFGTGPAITAADPALRQRTSKPQTARPADCPRHAVEIPTTPTLSAAAVLGQPSHKPPLEFEGTLDGLRGIPIDDLAGITRTAAGVTVE